MGRDKILFAVIAIVVALAAFVVLDPLGDEGEDIAGTSGRSRETRRGVDDEATPRRAHGAGGGSRELREHAGAGVIDEEAPPIEKKDVFGVPYSAVAGRVIDLDGAAVEGASVELFDAAPGLGNGRAIRGARLAGVESRTDGTFEFHDVESTRTYVLRGARAGFMRYTASLTPSSGETVRIDVVLRRGITLKGRVTDAESGSGLAGATLRIYDLSDSTAVEEDAVEVVVVTGDQGAFAAPDVSPGNKRITASMDGFATATRPFVRVAPASARESYDFALVVGLEISGEVQDLDGLPIAGATVTARPVQGGELHADPRAYNPATRTDARGRFVVSGLGEGLYAVSASMPGYRQGSFGVVVDGNLPMRSKANANAGDEGLLLVLAPAPSVSGRVIDDATGDPLTAFRVMINRAETLGRVPTGLLQRVEHPRGEFTYSLPPSVTTESTLWMFALAPGYAGGSAEVDFSGEGPGRQLETVTGITIRMKRGATATGRVVDARGRGVVGARVRVVPPHVLGPQRDLFGRNARPGPNAGTSARTDAEGRFAVSNLRPGEHWVTVDHDSFAPLLVATPVTVGRAAEVPLGELRLVRGGRVRGVVEAEEGGGQEGAEVLLQTADLGGRTPPRRVRTGVGGAFDFRHVPPGRYTVSVVAVGGIDFRTTDHALAGVKPKTRSVTVEDDGDLEIVF